MGGHPAVLGSPPIVSLFTYSELLAHFGNLQALTKIHVRLTQLGHDLLYTVSPLHRGILSDRLAVWILSQILDQISERGQLVGIPTGAGHGGDVPRLYMRPASVMMHRVRCAAVRQYPSRAAEVLQ